MKGQIITTILKKCIQGSLSVLKQLKQVAVAEMAVMLQMSASSAPIKEVGSCSPQM